MLLRSGWPSTRRAVPIESDTGCIDQTRFDGGVAGDVAPAIARFTHEDVVHVGRIDTGTPNRFGHGTGARSIASTSCNEPRKAVPMAVLAVETITG